MMPDLIERARFWATQAKEPGPLYLHREVGYNYRLSNVLAAVGLAQLEVLEERIAARQKICQYYQRRLGSLPGVRFMPEAPYGEPNCWLTVIRLDADQFGAGAEEVRLALERENIEARRVWVPLHRNPAFAHCRYRGGIRRRADLSPIVSVCPAARPLTTPTWTGSLPVSKPSARTSLTAPPHREGRPSTAASDVYFRVA